MLVFTTMLIPALVTSLFVILEALLISLSRLQAENLQRFKLSKLLEKFLLIFLLVDLEIFS